MKELNDIDNLFKDAIEESADFAPSDKAWNSIEGKLQQKEARGNQKTIRNLRVSVAVVSVLFTSTLAYQYFSSKPEVKHAEQNTKITTTPNKAVSEQNTVVKASESAANTNSQPVKGVENYTGASKTSEPANQIVTGTAQDQPEETAASNKTATPEPKKLQSQTAPVTITEKDSKDNSLANNIQLLPYFVPDLAQKKNTAGENTQNEASRKNDAENIAPLPEKKENIIFVPNAFTPNGDGLNDSFLPKASEELTEYKMWIFDTRGTMVFFSDDFTKGWDGRSIVNGAETIKEDIYMWRMEIKNSKGEKEHLTGYLTLLKN